MRKLKVMSRSIKCAVKAICLALVFMLIMTIVSTLTKWNLDFLSGYFTCFVYFVAFEYFKDKDEREKL